MARPARARADRSEHLSRTVPACRTCERLSEAMPSGAAARFSERALRLELRLRLFKSCGSSMKIPTSHLNSGRPLLLNSSIYIYITIHCRKASPLQMIWRFHMAISISHCLFRYGVIAPSSSRTIRGRANRSGGRRPAPCRSGSTDSRPPGGIHHPGDMECCCSRRTNFVQKSCDMPTDLVCQKKVRGPITTNHAIDQGKRNRLVS